MNDTAHISGALICDTAGELARQECLVPVSLNLELEGKKIAESFLFNIADYRLSVSSLAQIICQDAQISRTSEATLVAVIQQQIERFVQYVPPPHGEHLITLSIEVRVGDLLLQDRFLWDINNAHANPEVFAAGLVADLGLPEEFVVATSHAIREQLASYTHDLLAGRAAPPYDAFCDVVRSEDDVSSWTAHTEKLRQVDMERLELVKGREERAARRRGQAQQSLPLWTTTREKPVRVRPVSQPLDPLTQPNMDENGELYCMNCKLKSSVTGQMRRGPDGPRTLCNKCGLVWYHHGRMRVVPSEK